MTIKRPNVHQASPGGYLLVISLALVFAGAAAARTITITADDCNQMAVILATAPRLSWSSAIGAGMFHTPTQLNFYPNMAILIRYPLERIPKGQRITKAEWTVPYASTGGTKQRLQARRILVEWGTGVCHDYRAVYPRRVEWSRPGGLGANADRANQPSAVFEMLNSGEQTVDMTEDIELWYTGAAPNRGWILTLDDTSPSVSVPAPYPVGAGWKLQITYEPK